MKHDKGKLQYHLMPIKSLEDIIAVLTHGAEKYSENNWKYVDNGRDRYYSAALRHMIAWKKGEITDEDSGLPHLAHALCCLIFLNEDIEYVGVSNDE